MSWGYTLDKSITGKQWDAQSPYVRPSEWITLSPITTSEQKCTGVYAVFPDNTRNYVAVLCQGNYTVDWGDGVTENVTSNTKVTHQYDYAAVGNLTSYGYKQVTITITPQAGQNLTVVNLRQQGVVANASWPTAWLDIEVGSPNLTSLVIGANNVTAFFPYLQRVRWASKSTSYTTLTDLFYYLQALQQVIIDADMSNVVNTAAMFWNCSSLKFAPWMDTSNVTDTRNMFGNCLKLINVPNYNLGKNTAADSMFLNCTDIKQIAIFNTGNVTSFASTFNGCSSLEYVPQLNVVKTTTMASAFVNCRALQKIEIINAGNCNAFNNLFDGCTNLTDAIVLGNNVNASNISMASMFNGCNSLSNVTLLDTSKVSSMSDIFANCGSLTNVPNLNTSNVTTLIRAFNNCRNIEIIPNLDTTKVTSFSTTFNGCVNLKEAPNVVTSNATTVVNMLQGCYKINEIPAYNLTNVASGSGSLVTNGQGFNVSTPIFTVSFTNLRATTNFTNCYMNANSLTNLFSNCLTNVVAASQTVFISANPGADTAVNKTSTWTNTSKVITMANTVGLATGYQVTGANIGNAIAVTIQANNTISTTNNIDNDTMVAFANVQTSNLTANTLYYVSNQANVSNTFYYDLSTSVGGTPLTFTSGTGNLNINRLITAINTNANITISAYPSGNGTSANATTRALNTNIASFKGWTVTG